MNVKQFMPHSRLGETKKLSFQSKLSSQDVSIDTFKSINQKNNSKNLLKDSVETKKTIVKTGKSSTNIMKKTSNYQFEDFNINDDKNKNSYKVNDFKNKFITYLNNEFDKSATNKKTFTINEKKDEIKTNNFTKKEAPTLNKPNRYQGKIESVFLFDDKREKKDNKLSHSIDSLKSKLNYYKNNKLKEEFSDFSPIKTLNELKESQSIKTNYDFIQRVNDFGKSIVKQDYMSEKNKVHSNIVVEKKEESEKLISFSKKISNLKKAITSLLDEDVKLIEDKYIMDINELQKNLQNIVISNNTFKSTYKN